MKKAGALIILSLMSFLILASLVLAANDTDTTSTATTPEDKGYACLKLEVKDKCSSIGMEAQAFVLLALAHDSSIQSECKTSLLANSKDNECWPKTGCKLRETSLAILALDNINADTEDSEDWLLSQTKTPDLEWYLQIDAGKETKCKIDYSGSSKEITLKEDKKISGNAGGCLTSARSGYWLQINSDCFEKNFTISCNEDFITALIYKKPGDDVWHISSKTNSASGGGSTIESVNALCFKQNNACNYEGSLWATFALINTEHDKAAYLPYLIAYADDNKALAPDAFLLLFTASSDYLSNIVSSQSTQGYWDLDSPYDSLYDTALNLLALASKTSSTDAIDSSKTWLASIQKTSGCWDSTRNTAFILYALWGKPAFFSTARDDCEDHQNYCMTSGECTSAAGTILTHFDCDAINKVCCDKELVLPTCLELNGQTCPTGQECSSPTVEAYGTNYCCLAGCQPISPENDCEDADYFCRSKCENTEEEKAGYTDCTGTDVCCAPKAVSEKSYWWIWLLVILIILTILGILFRDRLRILIFKFKNKFTAGKAETKKPPFPPSQPGRMMARPFFRPMPNRFAARPRPKPMSVLDKELDETLKKLKEMGK